MSDTGPIDHIEQLPDSVEGVSLTDQEQQEIRARIDQVTEENRIDVNDKTFSVAEARRGLALPAGVMAGVILVVAVGLLLLFFAFRRGEVTNRAGAGQYVSVEGRLIRALREESQAQLGAKNEEIETMRSRLQELEEQQANLEVDIEARIAAKEEEIRLELQQDIERERARLVNAGTASEDVARLMATYEAERRAFYERQLEEFKEELEAERVALQSNIDDLRIQYQARLDELTQDRDEILASYQKREAELRAQLTRRTQVAAIDLASGEELDAAGAELYELGQQIEQAAAFDTQIVGQIDRIRVSLTASDLEGALAQVNSLQTYLEDEAPLIAGSRGARRDADLFFVGQLRSMLENRIESAGSESVDAPSLIDELALLRQLRGLAASAEDAQTDEERDAASAGILAAFARLNLTTDLLDRLFFAAIRQDYEDKLAEQELARSQLEETRTRLELELEQARARLEAEIAEARANLEAELTQLRSETARERETLELRITALEQQIDSLEKEREIARRDSTRAELEDALLEARAELAESEEARAQMADQSGNAVATLQRRVSELSAYEEQVRLADERYQAYTQATEQVRRTNPDSPDTAARQELDEFLGSAEIRSLFADLATQVDVLFSATQTAGSSGALADAALIVSDIAGQPTRQAQLAMLQFEKDQIADDAELLAILSAMESILRAEQ